MLKGERIETFDFDKHVFPKELDDIRERLISRGDGEAATARGDGLPDFEELLNPQTPASNVLRTVIDTLNEEDNEAAWQDDPSAPHKGLVGLAFSGGGIRSATFNLGLMQALKKMGLFKCVDYLSTVSGGGYIGSCISSTLASVGKLPDAEVSEEPINEIFNHTQGNPEPNIFRHLRNNANYLAPEGLLDVLRIPGLLFRGIIVNVLVIVPYVLLAALFTVWLYPTPQALEASMISGNFVLTKLLLSLLVGFFALYPLMHMFGQKLRVGEQSNWNLRNRFGQFLGYFVALIIVAVFIELQPILIQFFDAFSKDPQSSLGALTAGSGALGTALALFAEKLLPKLSKFYGRLAIYFIGILGVGIVWLGYIYVCVHGMNMGKEVWGLYGTTALVLWLYTFFFVDVNFTGIHKFYRDRLSKAYIVGLEKPESAIGNAKLSEYQVVHTDNVKLSELNTQHGPYHLINTLLNLNRTEERFTTGRHGDFFLFSKHFIGGDVTGYCHTTDMEYVSRHIDLATAMAVSGAAAAPNMGKVTIKPLIFILAMLNVRLNFWLPNPARLWRKPEYLKQLPSGMASRVGPVFLLMEMFGLNSVKSRYVNLSDGGHIENLGVYELIRRQCRLIIVGDGEGDPSLKFQALAELVRMVQIDMGVKIEVDGLDEIRRGEQHHAIGTIHYPNGRKGKLIYLKSSLLGDNNLQATLEKEHYVTSPYRDDNLMFDQGVYIAHYKKLNAAFPHQSTGDQFFDEEQFECYRALGYNVAMNTLRGKKISSG